MPVSAGGVSSAGVRKPSVTADARHLPPAPGPGTQPPWTQCNTSDHIVQ